MYHLGRDDERGAARGHHQRGRARQRTPGSYLQGSRKIKLHYQQHERLGGETQHPQLTFWFFLSPILDEK